MFTIKHSLARKEFKQLLGQANHFLITILVGLDVVHSGNAQAKEEFSTSWNPKNVERSAERSREFVLELSLIRAVDSLDAYMMLTNRDPKLLDPSFGGKMDGAGQSITKRLEVFCSNIQDTPSYLAALTKLAITWRNQRVHSLSDSISLDKATQDTLEENRNKIEQEFRGLDVQTMLERFSKRKAPSFKEAAGVISATHKVVEHFDRMLLEQVNFDQYLASAMRHQIKKFNTSDNEAHNFMHVTNQIWGDKNRRQTKVMERLQHLSIRQKDQLSDDDVLVDAKHIDDICSWDVATARQKLEITTP